MKKMYDSDYREADLTTVDTPVSLTEQGADSPGSFEVPQDVSRLTEIIIAVAPDWTADAMYGFSSGLHLQGAGIQIGEGYFPGPVGSTCGAAATSSGAFYAKPQRYLTNIKVNAGGSINATGVFMGEAMGALHMLAQLVFDGPPGRIVDMDYREENLTAANTLVSLQARHGAAEADFKVLKGHIAEIHFAAGLKGVAGPLRFAPALHLSGAGFVRSGLYKFLGPSGGVQDDLAISGDSVITDLMRFVCRDLPIKKGRIRAQAQMIEDDPGTGYAIVGLGYSP